MTPERKYEIKRIIEQHRETIKGNGKYCAWDNTIELIYLMPDLINKSRRKIKTKEKKKARRLKHEHK